MSQLKTEEMVLNMGPHHPSTHGVLRFVVTTDGEVIHKVTPDVGYLHRSIEKIAEQVTYPGFMPYTDRVDYLAAMNANLAYALAVEKLLGTEVPPRANYLRVIVAELNRIISHLVAVGSMAMDIGAFTPFLHALREREAVNDLIEELCGARLTYNYIRIGGVSHDLTEGWREKTLAWINHFEPIVDEFNRLITFNKIYTERLHNIGIITPEDAISYGLTGPNLRASGVDYDLRRDEPYAAYPDFEFKVIVGEGKLGTIGDCFERFWVRVLEMIESCRIVRQALEQLPEGDIQAKVGAVIKPPPGDVYVRSESTRGEMGIYLISDGSNMPYRLKIRTGSFASLTIIEHVAPGMMIADMVALIASLDVVAPEVDR
ncbi:MAG: NADH-quinone oxidoreductase subunit D [Gemmatimonadetes bacterium]|nr:MAG: NADH-quinone oxidoreductase subunit D [Gemmatimonadota bacterium]